MSHRTDKLTEYLKEENYEIAVNYHRSNPRVENEETELMLAKAYFVMEDY
jgi:hypothetical protein